MLGDLDAIEIEDVMRRGQVGRLGVWGDGRVYIFPISYGYDGAFVYGISHPGLKVRLMRENPQVCLEVEEIESPARWRTVLAHGRFEEIEGEAARDAALAAIVSQGCEPAPPSLAPYIDEGERFIAFRIRLTERTGRFERDEVFRSTATAGRDSRSGGRPQPVSPAGM
jgi:nitroimidazol reductase NimA-like FMN-containing flavoprotein (pyridoxamine 5'-phosphate oxidase superfamily)